MVLVDTSVWIRFLANRPPYAPELDGLLDRNEVAAHDLIEGELLIGDPGKRRELMTAYRHMHRVATVPHAEVAGFVRSSNLHGRGIGWIDAHLLASALIAGVPLWTADQRLNAVAGKLGLRYVPGTQ